MGPERPRTSRARDLGVIAQLVLLVSHCTSLRAGSFGDGGASDVTALDVKPADASPGDAKILDSGPVEGSALDGRSEAGDFLQVIHDNPDAGALRSVWGSSASDVVAVGDQGAALSWTAGPTGEPTPLVLGDGANMTGVWGTGPANVYAVGTLADQDVAVILRREPAGWIYLTASYPHGMNAVGGTAADVYAVGNDGVIVSGPGFASAIQEEPNPYIPLTTYAPILSSISATGPDNIMVAGNVDTTLYYDGTAWHDYTDPTDRTRTYVSVFGAPDAGTDFFWGANYYGLWHFTGKLNPVLQLNEERGLPQDFSLYIRGIWGLTPDRVVCVGDEGRILTFDKVTGVKIHPAVTGRNLYAIWGTSFDDLWIVGDGQLVLHGSVAF